jgi:thiamine biosynthesis lipoprotein
MRRQLRESELTSRPGAAGHSRALQRDDDWADLEVRRARPLLGTVVEIRAHTPYGSTGLLARLPDQAFAAREVARLHAAVDAAFDQVELVHRLMSYHDPDSELSLLNRREARGAQRVDPHTYHVLTAAVHFARLSRGAFDPCVAESLESWGYLPAAIGSPDGRRSGRPESPAASWEDIELLSGYRVRFKHRLRMDLGGIAKGYAVDLATRTLQRANVHEILVNAGGDLRVAGIRPHEVCLRHPQAPITAVNPLQLRNGALASSAAYFSRRLSGSRHVSALLDPRTREPYVGNDAVSIRAADCMTADALTKVVLFAPTSIAERVLDECGAEALVLRPQP